MTIFASHSAYDALSPIASFSESGFAMIVLFSSAVCAVQQKYELETQILHDSTARSQQHSPTLKKAVNSTGQLILSQT
jgi:hypothetical protein